MKRLHNLNDPFLSAFKTHGYFVFSVKDVKQVTNKITGKDGAFKVLILLCDALSAFILFKTACFLHIILNNRDTHV